MEPQIKEILRVLPAARRRSRVAIGVGLFLGCLAFYLATACGMYAENVWLAAVSATFNGVAIALLFLVGHDACHGSLTPVRRLNRLLGRLSFLPSLHLYSGWARSHNQMHHGWTNLKGYDPGYAPFSKDEYDALPLARRMRERIYRTPLGIGLFYLIELWWNDQFFPAPHAALANRREFAWDRALVAAYFLVQCGVFYAVARALGNEQPVLGTALRVLFPWGVFLWFMGFVTLQQHTHPEIPWFDDEEEWTFFQAQVAGTAHVRLPRWIEVFFLNIFEHSAHHVDPLTPLYRLPEAQRALETAYPDDIRIVRCTPLSVWNTLRTCKLYDYEAHRWLDFAGRATTGTLVDSTAVPCLEAATAGASI